MKITGKKYDVMAAAVKAVVENAGGAAIIKRQQAAANWTQGRMLWTLWHCAERNLLYDDNHPGFAGSHWVRVYPQCPGFNVYSENVNDAHIETALRKLASELGLI